VSAVQHHPLGIYVHVPFCAARCGYCDFNTYVPSSDRQPSEFVQAAILELRQARAAVGENRPARTVYFGGGTPTLLGAGDLLRLLAAIAETFGLEPDAEVSTEANPESVDSRSLVALRRGGFTRISLGMQSAAPHVLRTLDRVHTSGRALAAAIEARDAGFEHVSLDLIYGTPGESDRDWEQSVEAALSAAPDHISAYGLTVEPGTALAASVRRGRLPPPDDGEQARRYRWADQRLEAAGLSWYELSSWAASQTARCHHNIGYWRSFDWWGIGPGAHSHLGPAPEAGSAPGTDRARTRFWNVLRPGQYAALLAAGRSPIAGSETLSSSEQALESVMLGLRLRGGLRLEQLSETGARAAELEAAAGRVTIQEGRIELTLEGRLFADAVVRALSD
jgi:putative oxygen-independent coproporphyrinogen III oxidase